VHSLHRSDICGGQYMIITCLSDAQAEWKDVTWVKGL